MNLLQIKPILSITLLSFLCMEMNASESPYKITENPAHPSKVLTNIFSIMEEREKRLDNILKPFADSKERISIAEKNINGTYITNNNQLSQNDQKINNKDLKPITYQPQPIQKDKRFANYTAEDALDYYYAHIYNKEQ